MRRIAGSVSLALALAACAVPLATAPDTGSAAPLRLVRPTDLCVTEGRVHALAGERMEVTAPAMRAVVAGSTSEAAELAFVYQGPASGVKPLASGEVRRQIGLKLRAQDTCNVVYVMWRVEPASKIAVQVKRNPGKRRHAECRDGGYRTIAARGEKKLPPLAAGERHVLRAVLDGSRLEVLADGESVWEGDLGDDAAAFDGPVGLRSDNGRFAFELAVPPGGAASCASVY